MLKAKKGRVEICVAPTKKFGDVVVALDIDVECSHATLRCLKNGAACACTGCCPKACHETVVCQALAAAVDQKLAGTPLEASRSRVGGVKSSYCCGHFTMSWHTQGTVSAVRKSLGLALSVLDPVKTFPIYQQMMRLLKKTPDREEFNYAADKVATSINGGVSVMVAGRIKATREHLDALLDVVAKKLSPSKVDGKKTKAECKECEGEAAECCVLKCSGWECSVAMDYVASRLRGLCFGVCGHSQGVAFSMPEAKMKPLLKKLSSGVKDYVAKFKRVAPEEVYQVMCYIMIDGGVMGACCGSALMTKKPSAGELEKAISKIL